MHCKACDCVMPVEYIDDAQTILEICCTRCRSAAFHNGPEEEYEGLWLNKHGHPSHVVMSPIIIELEEARAKRVPESA